MSNKLIPIKTFWKWRNDQHSLKNNKKVHGYKLHIRNYKKYANPAKKRHQFTPVRMTISKTIQTINAEWVVEKCIPSTVSGS